MLLGNISQTFHISDAGHLIINDFLVQANQNQVPNKAKFCLNPSNNILITADTPAPANQNQRI